MTRKCYHIQWTRTEKSLPYHSSLKDMADPIKYPAYIVMALSVSRRVVPSAVWAGPQYQEAAVRYSWAAEDQWADLSVKEAAVVRYSWAAAQAS